MNFESKMSGRVPAPGEPVEPTEDRFRSLVEGSGDVVWEIDPEGRYTYVSPNVAEHVGYSAEEILEHAPFQLTQLEKAAEIRSKFRSILAGGKPFRLLRFPSRHRDGRKVVLELSGRPFFGLDGALLGFRGIGRDVTEQDRRERLQGALYEISEAASRALDLPDLFQRVHRVLEGLMPSKNLYIALVDRAGKELSFPYFVDEMDEPEPTRPLAHGLTEYVYRTGRTLLASPEEFEALTRSGEVEPVGAWSVDWLGVPLKTRERTIGVLAVQSYDEGTRYTPDEARMLEFVSSQIALAIERKEAEDSLRAAALDMRETIADLERRNEEVELLADTGRKLQASGSVDQAQKIAGSQLGRLFPESLGRLYRGKAPGLGMTLCTSWGGARPSPAPALEECWALRLGRPHSFTAGGDDLRCDHVGERVAWSLCIPLLGRDGTPNFLVVEGDHGLAPTSAREASRLAGLLSLAAAAAEQVVLAVSNHEYSEILREQAIRDPLTGLYNRRFLEEALEKEIRRATRRGDSLGVLMIDLDRFKSFNDALGHEAGDSLLRAIGRFLTARVRAEDVACRYGGEEFTILLPAVSERQMMRRAEELRAQAADVARHASGAPPQVVTFSIGAALWPRDGADPAAILRAADEALYRAKAAGRDRVALAGTPA